MRSESVGLLSFHIPDCYWLDKFAMLSASFLTSLDSWADSRKLSQTDLVSDRGQERGRGENTKNVSLIRYVTPGIFAGLWLVSSAKYCPLIGWSGSHSNLHRVTIPAISDSHRSSSALSHIRACARGRFALFSISYQKPSQKYQMSSVTCAGWVILSFKISHENMDSTVWTNYSFDTRQYKYAYFFFFVLLLEALFY